MKKSTWIISLISFCITVLFLTQVYSYNKANIQTNAVVHKNNFILSKHYDDIDGDGKDDDITITGKKFTETDTIASEINISVKFSKTGFTKKTNNTALHGNSHKLHILDFTGDGKKDIMLCVTGENNTRELATVIYDFTHSIPKNTFSEDDNSGVKFIMKYADNFTINATLNQNQNLAINLKKRSKELVGSGIYSPDGIALDENTPQITKYINLSPFTQDNSNASGLCGTQQIIDKNNSVLCEVTSYIEYTNNKWQIYKIEYSYPKEETVS